MLMVKALLLLSTMLPNCRYCHTHTKNPSEHPNSVVCFGHFTRRSDNKRLQRYRCRHCKRTFSDASFSLCYYQKKRHLNAKVFEFYSSGVSLRRSAILLRANRKTIVNKLLFIGAYAYEYLQNTNKELSKAKEVIFDDLETFEHSKCKPISAIIAVEKGTRRILGFRVARMPAKGLLAKISRKKYGKRPDERSKVREELFNELKDLIEEDAVFQSDQNPHYGLTLRKHFPKCKHVTYKGRRGCVVGQGELKAGGYDPIFSLNHTFAMARANMNRLFRRTWCTTKLPERLAIHLALYSLYHNLNLINKNKIRTV